MPLRHGCARGWRSTRTVRPTAGVRTRCSTTVASTSLRSMSTPAGIGLQRWHEAIAGRDPAVLPGLIAEDAVFRSPAVHTPQEGRDLVTAYLAGAMVVLGPELTYHDEWLRERDA